MPPPVAAQVPAPQSSEFVIKLKALEDGLLSKLSGAQGDLTEDEALIVSLEESKALADEISEKVGGSSSSRQHQCRAGACKPRVRGNPAILLAWSLSPLRPPCFLVFCCTGGGVT